MSIEIRPCRSVEEVRGALNAISHYFGGETSVEDADSQVEDYHSTFVDKFKDYTETKTMPAD